MSYFEYLKNKKLAKREMAKLMATTLPLVNEVNSKNADIARFAIDLIEACKGMKSDVLVNKIISESCILLETTQPRLIEIFKYLMSLKPNDIQKILVHSAVHTNTDLKNDK